MGADPITAVGNALAGLFGVIKPSIDEHYAQKYDDAHKDRMREWQDLVALSNPDDRASRIGSFVTGMLDDAGTPVGQFSGTLVQVPVEILNALIQNTSESIRDEQRLARITFKTN